MKLSIDEVRFFHLNGYLAISNPIVAPDELIWVREAYDAMFSNREGWDSGDR